MALAEVPWLCFLPKTDTCVLHEETKAFSALKIRRQQRPIFVTTIGKRSKRRVLDVPIPACDIAPRRSRHCVSFLQDAQSCDDEHPLVLLDCETDTPSATIQPSDVPATKARNISWFNSNIRHPKTADLKKSLCNAVFAPFSHVVCYFAKDLGGVRGIAYMLAEYATTARACDLPSAAQPRALVVFETNSSSFDPGLVETNLLNRIKDNMVTRKHYSEPVQSLVQADIDACFSSISVLGLRRDQPHNTGRFHKRLHSLVEDAHRARQFSKAIFSFPHFQALSGLALDNFCLEKLSIFSFISASRPYDLSYTDFQGHLCEFINTIPCEAWLWHLVCPIVASALLLATYPPGSHRESVSGLFEPRSRVTLVFDPEHIFAKVYQTACNEAIAQYSPHLSVHRKFVSSVELNFRTAFDRLAAAPQSAAKLHFENLEAYRAQLSSFKSKKSCFCCLMRFADKVLDCGHSICDTCIKIYGSRSGVEKHTFTISECVLCGKLQNGWSCQFMPPTAGVRILSLDGGGIRGVVPLVYLKSIEAHLSNFGAPLQDYFDLVCGTSAGRYSCCCCCLLLMISSGGLIIMGLFLMQWDTEQCLQQFEELAAKTFKRRRSNSAIFARMQELALSYLNDCQYSSEAIEQAFRASFGSPPTMFNPLRRDTKVAVTTTTARDVIPCIFSNYNGVERPAQIGKHRGCDGEEH